MIIAGGIAERFTYSNGYIKGGDPQNPNGRAGSSQELSEEEKKENRAKVRQRAKNTVRRLINANVGQYDDITPKFMTLTYEENETDITKCNKHFKDFILRLNFYVFRSKLSKLKYVSVIEFQERGAVHYHVVFFNLPYIKNDRLRAIWSHGFVRINKIKEVDNVGAYVTKYMTKEDDERLKGRKSYTTSKGLYQPIEITEKKMIETCAESLSGKDVYSVEFDNDFVGHVSYVQYNMNRRQK